MSNKVTPESIEAKFMKMLFDEKDDLNITYAKRVGFYSVVIDTLCDGIYADSPYIVELLYGPSSVE